MQCFYWVIENQPMVALILTQHSSRKKNLEADEREVVVCIYIYTIDLFLWLEISRS